METLTISKEEFQAYEQVRASGVTNMWDTEVVANLSGLDHDTILEIMRRYSELNVAWPDVRKEAK